MEEALLEIIEALRAGKPVDSLWLDKLVRRYNRAAHDGTRTVAKRRLLPYYLDVRKNNPERWASWNIDDTLHESIVRFLQAKPRRTASGVATITVLTKPWPCSGDCVFCPSDIRMPKSYLADEPACQRAERCWFDPYLQVAARLDTLEVMGHVTDKVELIVLGGTWNDYPEGYQRWFIGEMLEALNASEAQRSHEKTQRETFYGSLGIPKDPLSCKQATSALQQRINEGELTYNEAWAARPLPQALVDRQTTTWDELFERQHINETSRHRMVGLVVETRPDLITPDSCLTMRALGCTKIQMGIQSLRDDILEVNGRAISTERIAYAMALLRHFGFKSHVHFMANLIGATPETDIADYARLVNDPAFLPDEVKLYPCALVESAHLTKAYEEGRWHPYTEEELVDVLAADVAATPPWTRISRMIRDISASDILVGNKKANLRQIVDRKLTEDAANVREIRAREISVEGTGGNVLTLETLVYHTSNTEERFLQWITPDERIAGFLRLSFPRFSINTGTAFVEGDAPILGSEKKPTNTEAIREAPKPDEAMIREVHVYGKVAAFHHTGDGAQHRGLGKQLVEEACRQAAEDGFRAINVISAVGTRGYYHRLGFTDAGLYQKRPLP